MNNRLLASAKKPALYEKSSHAFWDDEYISNQMLQAHLSQDTDAASRKAEFIESSVAWISQLLPSSRYPRLLDLGCGPGLYCEHFCRSGYDTTGYDISRRSIQHAAKSASEQKLEIKYECKDYLGIHEAGQYDLCTMIYCDYGALSKEDRQLVLSNIRSLLKPEGIFLFDVFTQAQHLGFVPSKTWNLCEGNGFWKEEPYIELSENAFYEPNVYLHRHLIVTEKESSQYLIWDTVFDPNTITEELEANGFEPVHFFGNVSGSPLTSDSKTMAVICKKKQITPQ